MRRTDTIVAVVWLAFWFGLAAVTQINLTTQVTGILPTTNGGTGQNSTATFPTSGTVLTGPLATISAALSSDVTMTTAGTFYDGPTNALTAAKWLLTGNITLQTTSVSAADQFVCKLWDGTTVVASSEVVIGATSSAGVKNTQINLSGVVTPTGSVTWKISCTSNTASQLIKAATPQYGAGNNASTLFAVRLQ